MPISKGVQGFARFSLYGIVIFLASSYLVRHFAYPSASATPAATQNQPATPEDRNFSARSEAAKKLFQSGQYASALDTYREAQEAVPQLNDREYESLKEGRLEIARAYEASGDSLAASNAYVAMTNCAMQEAKKLLQAYRWDRAIARAQDAAQFAHQVTDRQRLVVYRATDLLVTAYRSRQNVSEALQEQQKLVAYLESSGEQDQLLAMAYGNLGTIDADARQWDDAEQALTRAGEISDLEENRQRSADAEFDRNLVDYQLVSLCLRAGKSDVGLTRAEEYYTKYRESTSTLMYKYKPASFASLGLALAKQSKNQDAIDLWEKRTHETP